MKRIHDRKAVPRRGTRGTIVRLALATLVVAGGLGGTCGDEPIGPPFSGSGGIEGFVSVDFTPRSGVTVTLRWSGRVAGTGTTNSNGRYEFNDLDRGTYRLSIPLIPGATCPGEKTVVITADPDDPIPTFTRVDFACSTEPILPNTGMIRGRVVVGGEPRAGAVVQVPGRPSVTTDASGAFNIINVPPGDQTITTTLTGHTCPTRTVPVIAELTVHVGDIPCTPNPGTLIGAGAG